MARHCSVFDVLMHEHLLKQWHAVNETQRIRMKPHIKYSLFGQSILSHFIEMVSDYVSVCAAVCVRLCVCGCVCAAVCMRMNVLSAILHISFAKFNHNQTLSDLNSAIHFLTAFQHSQPPMTCAYFERECAPFFNRKLNFPPNCFVAWINCSFATIIRIYCVDYFVTIHRENWLQLFFLSHKCIRWMACIRWIAAHESCYRRNTWKASLWRELKLSRIPELVKFDRNFFFSPSDLFPSQKNPFFASYVLRNLCNGFSCFYN